MLFLIPATLVGQVTIGSGTAPRKGALLDLKDSDSHTNPQVTANKGFAMPRVKLTDMDNLYPMFTGDESDYATQKMSHVGLIVYNISGESIPRCAPIPDGLYSWDGEKWRSIWSPDEPVSIDLGTKRYYDLPSGRDARGAINMQSFDITWSPTRLLTYTEKAITGASLQDGGVLFSNVNRTASPLKASPAIFSMIPDVMNISNPDSPWQSRETALTFTITDECGETATETITLNQTNYALKVNNQFSSNQSIYTTAGNVKLPVEGNVAWTTVKTDPSNILSSTSPIVGSTQGSDRKDGTTANSNFQYTVAAGNKYQTADITFKDTQTIKRFDDITVSILNCTTEPNMGEWKIRADLAGFAKDVPHPITKIAWHTDQNDNIFFSGNFGYEDAPTNTKERRWMITNLAATSFADTDRTGTDDTVLQNLGTSPSATNNSLNPLWCYPNGGTDGATATTFNNNPRIGRLYNWAAATNSKGNTTTGEEGINEGEELHKTTIKRQGICPNGWHLPSDAEYTELEQEINLHTSQYSGIADANGTITVGDNERGTTHGQGMKDSCPAPDETIVPNGSSNIISSTLRSGFGVLLVGYANGSKAKEYGETGIFWSASGSPLPSGAWSRKIPKNLMNVTRYASVRHSLFSVRCKKDN